MGLENRAEYRNVLPTNCLVVGNRTSHARDLPAGILRVRAAPEAWRMAEECQPSQDLPSVSSHESSHPAGKVLIGSHVRQDQRLRTTNARRDCHESAIFAHVDRLGIYMERFVSEPAVEHDGDGGWHSFPSPPFRSVFCSLSTCWSAPLPKKELNPAHVVP